jgi:hypothetical protein
MTDSSLALEPGPFRKSLNRIVDSIAFGIIKHCLSRARHQRFDAGELDAFAARWSKAPVEEFYALDDFPGSADNARKLREHLRDFRPQSACTEPSRSELVLDSPLSTGCENNDRFWLNFHLGHPIDKTPLFIILHGWRSVSVSGYRKMCRTLNRLGVNAIVTHLPYHFSRKPPNSFNGELAISADLVRSANGLRHGVLEMRWLAGELKALGVPAVGLWGTSYGGWISALTAAVEPRIDAALLLETPVEIEKIFWEIPLFEKLTAHLKAGGVAREPIRHLFDLVTPHKHAPRIDPKKILILGSLYDGIATPKSLQLLHQSWPGSYLEIFPYAHISYRLHLAAIRTFEERLLPQLRSAPRSR